MLVKGNGLLGGHLHVHLEMVLQILSDTGSIRQNFDPVRF